MTLQEKKETAEKILALLDGLNYNDAYYILEKAIEELGIRSFVSVRSSEVLQGSADMR